MIGPDGFGPRYDRNYPKYNWFTLQPMVLQVCEIIAVVLFLIGIIAIFVRKYKNKKARPETIKNFEKYKKLNLKVDFK